MLDINKLKEEDILFFKEYPQIYQYLSENTEFYNRCQKRAESFGKSLGEAVLEKFGNPLMDECESLLIKNSWNSYVLSHLSSFVNASIESVASAKAKAQELGYHISAKTVYPISFDGINKRSRYVTLNENYLFLTKIACKCLKSDNIYIEIYTKSEIEALQDQYINNAKTSILKTKDIDLNPRVGDISAVMVSLVKNSQYTQIKLYGIDRLRERATCKTILRKYQGRGNNHENIEMIKKTALRLYCKELGVDEIHNLDLECEYE